MRQIALFSACLLLASAGAAAHITPEAIGGVWAVSGKVGGTSFTGTVTFTATGKRRYHVVRRMETIAGKQVTGRLWTGDGYLTDDHRLVVRLRRADSSERATVTYKYWGKQLTARLRYGDGSRGTEVFRRPSSPAPQPPKGAGPKPAPAGPNAGEAQLFDRIAAGSHTRADALAYLEKNWVSSQEYITKKIRKNVHPNYTKGHRGRMTGIVLHYTAGQWMDATLRYFTMNQTRKASSHFVVDVDGRVIQVFKHTDRSWHAGPAYNHTHFGFDWANAGYLKPKAGGFADYIGRTYVRNLAPWGTNPLDWAIHDSQKDTTRKRSSRHGTQDIVGF